MKRSRFTGPWAGAAAGDLGQGRPVFEELLSDLGDLEQDGAFRSGLQLVRLPHLDSGAPSRLTIDRAKQAYRGLDDDGSRAASVTASEEEAVRMELGLARSRTIRELQQLRRRFARANHPDRAPAWLRPRRLLRMKIANALIDEALHTCRAE